MNKKTIRLAAEDAFEFVSVANLCEFDIFIFNQRYMANAKNVEDVTYMDFSKPLTVEFSGHDSFFESFLKRLEVAC